MWGYRFDEVSLDAVKNGKRVENLGVRPVDVAVGILTAHACSICDWIMLVVSL